VLRDDASEEAWLATMVQVRSLRMLAASKDGARQATPEVAAHEAIDVAR